MAPPASKDTTNGTTTISCKDGLLSDHNSMIPLTKLPIDTTNQLESLYDMEAKPFARGKFATVKHCCHRSTKTPFAAKCIKKRRRLQDVTPEIFHEVRILMLASSCPRIIDLYSVFETSHEYVLILELASGGELQRVLDEEEFLPESACKHIMRQVLEGISFLHDHSIAHLDIKPQNILLTSPLRLMCSSSSSTSLTSSSTNASPDSSPSHSCPTLLPASFDISCCDIKICDFGISRVICHGYDLREIIGTPDYVAPEILNYEPICLATDMWSIGCLTYVLLSGCSPFGGDDKVTTFSNITSTELEFPDDFDGVSESALDFMRKLIVKEPKKRLTSKEAYQHEWMCNNNISST